MEVRAVEAIAEAWNQAGVRYLMAGGLADAAHGDRRFEARADFILGLEASNTLRGLQVLERLRYCAPSGERENGAPRIFSNGGDSLTDACILAEHPLDFTLAHARALWAPLPSGSRVACVSLEDARLLRAHQSYEQHRQAQLKRHAKLSFARGLQWLEDAQRLVLALDQEARRQVLAGN